MITNKQSNSHPSLAGQSTKLLTRELVYYILLGTLRGSQKYHWPVLRVPFGGDIHPWSGHFSRSLCRPWITMQIVAMNSWRNSDVFNSESSIWGRYSPLKWQFLQRPLQTSDWTAIVRDPQGIPKIPLTCSESSIWGRYSPLKWPFLKKPWT